MKSTSHKVNSFQQAFDQACKNTTSHRSDYWIYVHPDQLDPRLLQTSMIEDQRIRPGFLFVESEDRWRMLPFHKKRVVFEISAMRHLAISLLSEGFDVSYHVIRQPFTDYLSKLLANPEAIETGIHVETDSHQANKSSTDGNNTSFRLHVMEPASYDEREAAKGLSKQHSRTVTLHPNRFFLSNPSDYTSKIGPGYRMEFFYRDMRKELNLLMELDGNPSGGDWNFDKENRKPLPKKINLPKPPSAKPDYITQEVLDFVEEAYPAHFGKIEGFDMAVDRKGADAFADHFFENALASFGPYEDAMARGEYLIFHSALSSYINVGLLDPLSLCKRAEEAWKNGNAPINSVEGFIRQIIGWREFIRIYYEAQMPAVRDANALGFRRQLPEVFWSASSGMACMDDIVGGVLQYGWSHHITRLMVLSNFSNLTETDPYELYLWFWYGYTDAHDWVVLPNVLGMSTFADGGVLASKPYVSGGNYINKMSNYCSSCKYKITDKYGKSACPFNYLYWNFVDRYRDVFEENGRVSFMVNMFDKRKEEAKERIRKSAADFIDNLPRWSPDKEHNLPKRTI